MLSPNNINFSQIQADRSYIGSFDDVSTFSSSLVNLIADQPFLITMYSSQNRTTAHLAQTQFQTVANSQFIMPISLTSPYVYFTIQNTGSATTTICQFTVNYKTEIVSQRTSITAFNGSIANNGTSRILDVTSSQGTTLSVIGNSSVLGQIVVCLSTDGETTFYNSQYVYTLGAAGNFGFTCSTSCPFIRLKWLGGTSTIIANMSFV